jgi:hypothetical protein
VLGEFFLCSDDELEPLLIETGPDGHVSCVGANGLTPVNIASLGALLSVATYDELLAQCGNRHHESDGAESGVWNVPAAVAEALASNADLEPIAEQWVATEELKRDRWQKSDGARVLAELAGLLTQQEPGQVLWYWWSV